MKKIIIFSFVVIAFVMSSTFLQATTIPSTISGPSFSASTKAYTIEINSDFSRVTIINKNYKNIKDIINKLENDIFNNGRLFITEKDSDSKETLKNFLSKKKKNRGKRFKLKDLEELIISHSHLQSLDGVEKLKNLKTLYIANNDLDLSENSKTMKTIRKLEKKGVEVIYLPEEDEL